MLIGINRDEICEYISEVEKGSDKPTVFLLGNITNAQKMAMVGSLISSEGKVDMSELQNKTIDIVKSGLKGIKNLSVKGEIKDISTIDDNVIEMIPFQVLYELAGQIVKFNFDTGGIVKN